MPARRVRSSSRSRSALLWAAALYVAAQLCVSLLLDYRWPHIRFPSARVRLARLAEAEIKPDIVFLGSSRFEAGILPQEIVLVLDRQCRPDRRIGVFKSAVGCGDAIVCEFMFRKVLESGVRPSLLVLEISPETLNRNNEWLGMHVLRQLRWDDVPRYFPDLCRSMQVVRWLGERINPVYIHREELSRWAGASISQHADQQEPSAGAWLAFSPKPGSAGYPESLSPGELLFPPPTPLPPDVAAISRYGAGQPLKWLRNYRIRGSATAEALERVLRQCRELRIEVMLVGIPVTQPHRETYTPEIDREYVAYLDKLTREYGCRFVDYRDRVPDDFFTDNHHMSPVGGVYFSRLLTLEQLGTFCPSHGIGQDGRTASAH